MYRTYRETSNLTQSFLQQLQDWTKDLSKEEVDEINQIWKRVKSKQDEVELKQREAQRSSGEDKSVTWKTVRIFISSTFKDFYSEREVLVKKVFPELRDFCESAKIQIIDCDLRWGVPKDATGSEAVQTCLEQLDRCLEETNSQPFFLGLVGDRYGWVPGKEDIVEELAERYQWDFGSSVTQMEVVYGTMLTKSKNALFMMRRGDFYKDIPTELSKDFFEKSSKQKALVSKAKLEIFKTFPENQVSCYDVKFAGIKTEGKRNRVTFENLDTFAQQVLDFFKTAISKSYPQRRYGAASLSTEEEASRSDDEDERNTSHFQYSSSLTKFAAGHHNCLGVLQEFVESGEVRKGKLYREDEEAARMLVVTGGAGIGKSTIMARIGQQNRQKSNLNVFVHFSSLARRVNTFEAFTRRLKKFIEDVDVSGRLTEKLKDVKIDKEALEKLLGLLGELNSKTLIVIDGMEDMATSIFDFFGLELSKKVSIIGSCTQVGLAQSLRSTNAYVYELEELDKESCGKICDSYLIEYGKRLDGGQKDSLLSKTSVTHPLWLTSACEELRLHGDYSTLSKLIQDFPDSTQRLLTQIGARILQEDGEGGARVLLCLVTVSREGLHEVFVRKLLAFILKKTSAELEGVQSQDAVPMALLTSLLRKLKPFIHQADKGVPMITFRHSQGKFAAKELLFAKHEEEEEVWHRHMAEFYSQGHLKTQELACREIPYHMYWGEKRAELHKILTSNNRISMRLNQLLVQGVYGTWRCKNMIMEMEKDKERCQLVICSFCINMPSRLGVPRSKACVYCSSFTTDRKTLATTCMVHAAPSVSFRKCYVCARNDPRAQPASLCVFCSNNSKMCCMPVLETDFQYQMMRRSQIKRTNLPW